jgi:hypothetical protein
MGINSLTVLGMAALVAALSWVAATSARMSWVPGVVELASAVMFGIAALTTRLSLRQNLSRRLAGVAQLSMLLVVAVPCAIAPGGSRVITGLFAPAVVATLFSLFEPSIWERFRWLNAYAFVCALVGGILVTLYALLAAVAPFGTAG